MPKSHPRRNAAERENRRFRQVITLETMLFIRILEMAEGATSQHKFPALCVQKCGRSGACDNGADRGYGHTRLPGGQRERLEASFRNRTENFVIVTAGDQRRE